MVGQGPDAGARDGAVRRRERRPAAGGRGRAARSVGYLDWGISARLVPRFRVGGTADVWAPRFGPTCRGAVTEGMLGPACRAAGWTEVFRDGKSEHKFEVEGEN